jgi:hypothetical protein
MPRCINTLQNSKTYAPGLLNIMSDFFAVSMAGR